MRIPTEISWKILFIIEQPHRTFFQLSHKLFSLKVLSWNQDFYKTNQNCYRPIYIRLNNLNIQAFPLSHLKNHTNAIKLQLKYKTNKYNEKTNLTRKEYDLFRSYK